MMTLKDSLTQMAGLMPAPAGFKYGSIYGYFAAHGHTMGRPGPGSLFTDADPARRDKLRSYLRQLRPEVKQCFYNAQRLVQDHPDELSYCEGFVISERVPLPIHHAWCVYWLGKELVLIDPTLGIQSAGKLGRITDFENLIIGEPPPGWEYFGRGFPRATVEARWLETQEAGSLVDWPPKWPFLRLSGPLGDDRPPAGPQTPARRSPRSKRR